MSQKYDPTDLRFNPTIPEREARTFSLLSEDSDPHRPQRLKSDTVDLLTALSMGVDPADAMLRRYLPVDIYIDVDDRHDPFADEVIMATEILLVRFGLLEDERTLIEFGSIRKRSRWYTKDKETLNQLSEKMDMLEKAFHSANEGQLRMRIAQLEKELKEKGADKTKFEKIEAAKTFLEAVHNLMMILAGATVAVSLALGYLTIETVGVEGVEIKVKRAEPKKAYARQFEPTKITGASQATQLTDPIPKVK